MCIFYQIKSKKVDSLIGALYGKNQKMTFLSPNPRSTTLSVKSLKETVNRGKEEEN